MGGGGGQEVFPVSQNSWHKYSFFQPLGDLSDGREQALIFIMLGRILPKHVTAKFASSSNGKERVRPFFPSGNLQRSGGTWIEEHEVLMYQNAFYITL